MADTYTDKDIICLKGLEAVRKRPGTYVGDITSPTGVFQLIKEGVDNAIDEALAGYCKRIKVHMNIVTREVVISDNGRGIPQKSLPIVFGKLHSGSKFSDKIYKISSGLHGLGISSTNALSSTFECFSIRDGVSVWIHYKKGKLISEPCKKKPQKGLCVSRKHGTVIRFVPDPSIVTYKKLPYKMVLKWLETIPLLCPGLKIDVSVESKNKTVEKTFFSKAGLKGQRKSKGLYEKRNSLEVCINFISATETKVLGYVNTIPVREGSHLKAFWRALRASLGKYTKKRVPQQSSLKESVQGIFHLLAKDPLYIGQTKEILGDTRIEKWAYTEFKDIFDVFFEKHQGIARNLIKQASAIDALAKEHRSKLNSLKDIDKNIKRGRLPAVLAVSSTKNKDERELFCVEGESAGGTGKSARDRKYQEILPVKGKTLNIARKLDKPDKVLKNEEIQNIITSIGGIDPDKGRVGKIILLSDSDFDGPLDKNTRVLTLNGLNPTIKTLTEQWKRDKQPFWVYGRTSTGKLIPTLAQNPQVAVISGKGCTVIYDNGGKNRCTPCHKFVINNPKKNDQRIIWYKGLAYVRAKDLKPGDSLNSMYLERTTSDGQLSKDVTRRKYLSIVNEPSCYRYRTAVHRFVIKNLKPALFRQYLKANSLNDKRKQIDIHHKDSVGTNNDPCNLRVMYHVAHCSLHGPPTLARYNKSKKHSKTVSANNKRPDIQYLLQLGKYAAYILGLVRAGVKVTPNNWNKYAPKNTFAHMWDDNKISDSISLIRRKAYTLDKGWDIVLKNTKEKRAYPTQAVSKFVNMCRRTIQITKKLDEKTYTVCRRRAIILKQIHQGTPKWQTGLQKANLESKSLRTIKCFVEDYENNHVVKSVKIYNLKKPQKFYCMEVPETGNFMVDDGLGNGILSANSHITALLSTLFVFTLPKWIKEGRVYTVVGPLFHTIYKGKRYFGDTAQEVLDQVKGNVNIMRVKGWGEMKPEDLRYVALDPETRVLKRFEYTKKSSRKTMALMGSDTSIRKKLIGLD